MGTCIFRHHLRAEDAALLCRTAYAVNNNFNLSLSHTFTEMSHYQVNDITEMSERTLVTDDFQFRHTFLFSACRAYFEVLTYARLSAHFHLGAHMMISNLILNENFPF